jgi:signal transduction histidine kinase
MRESRWRTERVVDPMVAGALAALAVIQTVMEWRAGTSTVRVAVIAGVGLFAAALLLWRRRTPVAVVLGTAVCASLVALAVHHPATGPIAPAVALYTLAAQEGWRRTLPAGAAALALLALPPFLRGVRIAGPLTQTAAVLGIAALVGLYAGGQAQMSRAMAARAEQLEREQALLAREAVLAERLWIARELHDTIGHHVSLLVVQAGGVRATLSPEHPARPVLDTMISGGREAMTEMRRMVDLLRPVNEEPVTETWASSPDLSAIPALCEQLRRSGLPVELDLTPGLEVPRTVSVTAYRIVQEALTNVVKHAGLVPTRVHVVRQNGVLDLRITNSAAAAGRAPSPGPSGGHGQTGIRERASLFGGRVLAGPVPDGGYAVHVTLTLAGAS